MDLNQANNILNTYIRPQSFPLALKLCKAEAELPAKVRVPSRDLGYQVTLCQAIGLARRFRWAIAVGKNDNCCFGAAAAMGFIEKSPEAFAVPRLEVGTYSHILMVPIESADFEPDVILLYTDSAQAMRLVQAAGRGAGLNVSAHATGFGDCADIIAGTTISGECQFVLPGGGDRVFGGAQDHEVIFTIPFNKMEAVLQGLEETHKAGFRYPILADLRHPPALPDFLKIPEDAK